ncbi:MAG: NADH:flavin oxidoreductase [Planctomycetes bacterium]|nr:NADH:flavin oxidoreductase [Planctomycetota bacterium]
MSSFAKVAQLKSVAGLRERIAELGWELPIDDELLTAAEGSPLARSFPFGKLTAGNRWCIHPMEGWDANQDGTPSALTIRRWSNFGHSGAKLIWGGEAAAVCEEGRANPRQTLATCANRDGLRRLRDAAQDAHRQSGWSCDDLVIGLQLTHSGRFCKPLPDLRFRPRIAWHHPILDPRFGIDARDDRPIWTDSELETLIDQYVAAARLAAEVGFAFVDVKACHGYLLHEFLGARRRPGKYGGDFDGRTRLLLTIIDRIREAVPELGIAVRLSVFDTVPFQAGPDGGVPAPHEHLLPYEFGFGIDRSDPTRADLEEPIQLLRMLESRGIWAANISAGSPYYNPHLQRPAAFPPSDGYGPPEDPLVGVVRQIHAARDCKRAVPGLPQIGTGYSYLQDFLPHVAQAVVRAGWIDAVGIGRMVLAYPQLPADVLHAGQLQRKLICRTFSDCTTAPRNNLVSGCYPLDAFYKALPEADTLKAIKSKSGSS